MNVFGNIIDILSESSPVFVILSGIFLLEIAQAHRLFFWFIVSINLILGVAFSAAGSIVPGVSMLLAGGVLSITKLSFFARNEQSNTVQLSMRMAGAVILLLGSFILFFPQS
jgi:hypothetical protein